MAERIFQFDHLTDLKWTEIETVESVRKLPSKANLHWRLSETSAKMLPERNWEILHGISLNRDELVHLAGQKAVRKS